eukprot:2090230-Pleurochrysis_carterae.AAC.1
MEEQGAIYNKASQKPSETFTDNMKSGWQHFVKNRWNMIAAKVDKFILDNGKIPNPNSTTWPEKYYAEWINIQKTNFQDRKEAMKLNAVRDEWSKYNVKWNVQ